MKNHSNSSRACGKLIAKRSNPGPVMPLKTHPLQHSRAMCFASVCIVVAFAAWPLHAEELAGKGEPFRVLDISPEACARLAPYVSSGEADYQPGVAVDGSAVAPADLDGGYGLEPRSIYRFQVQIEPFNGAAAPYSNQTTLDVADVMIDSKTGRVTIDGHDMASGNRALAEACALQQAKPAR